MNAVCLIAKQELGNALPTTFHINTKLLMLMGSFLKSISLIMNNYQHEVQSSIFSIVWKQWWDPHLC